MRGPSGSPDLFGTPILGVSEVSGLICDLLDDMRLHQIWVRGEVTNYKDHASGHRYFSLSEQNGRSSALINCVMWRTYARSNLRRRTVWTSSPGTVEVYEPHGRAVDCQGDAPGRPRRAPPDGGALKTELDAEGLFSPERRWPPPAFRTGSVWSPPTGAALKDILWSSPGGIRPRKWSSTDCCPGRGGAYRDHGGDPAGRRTRGRDHRRPRWREFRRPLSLQPPGCRAGRRPLQDPGNQRRRARGGYRALRFCR